MATELERPQIHPALMSMVNKPIVQSLLYDLDLLPEQLRSQKVVTAGLVAAYHRLTGVLMAFKAMELNEIPPTTARKGE